MVDHFVVPPFSVQPGRWIRYVPLFGLVAVDPCPVFLSRCNDGLRAGFLHRSLPRFARVTFVDLFAVGVPESVKPVVDVSRRGSVFVPWVLVLGFCSIRPDRCVRYRPDRSVHHRPDRCVWYEIRILDIPVPYRGIEHVLGTGATSVLVDRLAFDPSTLL